eukprot:223790_1
MGSCLHLTNTTSISSSSSSQHVEPIESYPTTNCFNCKKMNSIGQTPSNEDDIFSSESIRISHKFWTENVLTLNADARQTISVLFFANLFHKIPECRKLIQCDIGNRAQQLFGMVEWLIMLLNLNSVHHDLFIRLEALGTLHTKWGVSENHYLPM